MRILVAMTTYPYPPQVGSAVIAYNNIKEISKNHSIDIVCLDTVKEYGELSKYVHHIDIVEPRSVPQWMSIIRSLYYILRGVPKYIRACTSAKMRNRVMELIEKENYHAILLYEIAAIQYFHPKEYCKIIVNTEDPQSIRLQRMSELPIWSWWDKIKLLLDIRILRRYEKKYLPRMAKVLLLSENDAHDMRTDGKYDNIGCVTYGVHNHAQEEILQFNDRREWMILFSGSMFHPPNVEGILYFMQTVFPIVLQHSAKAELWIVGSNPDPRIREEAVKYGSNVVITGRVEDMSEYLRSAKVSICPVRLKIGVQTKILEALSWGTPVVSTQAGNNGIGGISGKQLWVEDTPELFANHVIELLHGDNWNTLSEEGRKLIGQDFSWEKSALELDDHIKSIKTKQQNT
ncbi:MAG: glycosyltransferase [Bacteroidota bacterium]